MQVKTAVIQAGQFVSDVFSLGQITPYVIITPSSWVPANLQFQFSTDGTSFYDVSYKGIPMEVVCPAPNAAVKLVADMWTWPNGTYLKFISRTNKANIIQPVACTLRIIAT